MSIFNPNQISVSRAPINIEKKTNLTIAPLIDVEEVFNTSTHIYVVYDASGSMKWTETDNDGSAWLTGVYEKTRWWAQCVGLIALFREIQFFIQQAAEPLPLLSEDGADFLVSENNEQLFTDASFADIRHSVQLVAMRNELDHPNRPTVPTFTALDMSSASYESLIDFLVFERDTRERPGSGTLFGNNTNFGAAMSYAPDFFASAGANKKVVLFFTDGASFPFESLAPAVEIANQLDADGVDIYAFNILRKNTNQTAQLDNTPEDGVPVLTTLSALSWGLWQTVIAPVSYRIPATPVQPERILQTAGVVTRLELFNPAATPVEVEMRYRRPETLDAPTIARRLTLLAGEQRGIGLEGDIVNAGEVLQATCPIGHNFQISAMYLERTEEPIE